MEQIVKKNGQLYYGSLHCNTINDAYNAFRKDYHTMLGKSVYRRLDRLGQRKERLHSYGFVFDDDLQSTELLGIKHRYNCYILDKVDLGYVRTIGCWEYSDISESDFEKWLDWVYTRGGGRLRTLDVRVKKKRRKFINL